MNSVSNNNNSGLPLLWISSTSVLKYKLIRNSLTSHDRVKIITNRPRLLVTQPSTKIGYINSIILVGCRSESK